MMQNFFQTRLVVLKFLEVRVFPGNKIDKQCVHQRATKLTLKFASFDKRH